jgi:hypothetical protein
MGSEAMFLPLRHTCLGKVWWSDDPEPGELPVQQSPLTCERKGGDYVHAFCRHFSGINAEASLSIVITGGFFLFLFCRL